MGKPLPRAPIKDFVQSRRGDKGAATAYQRFFGTYKDPEAELGSSFVGRNTAA